MRKVVTWKRSLVQNQYRPQRLKIVRRYVQIDSNEFANQVVLVTGAGSGIGAATAKLFAQRGAKVAVTDINLVSAQKTAEEINNTGGNAIAILHDVSNMTHWENVRDEIHSKLGELNVVHNNAFMKIEKSTNETSIAEWEKQISVNLVSMQMSVLTFLPDLKKNHGAIVNTSSIHANFGFVHHGAYAASKGGMVAFGRQLAVDYGPEIRVNTVLPGPILTPIWDDTTDEYRNLVTSNTPLRRMGKPEEVAEAVCFLASSRASYISGTTLTVDGGYTAEKA
ncbi:MAG: SDR family oxidoreductase [Actinobacteria bacterium]|nr:SDR family oxidoreductase [Actinomycetota bacterium]MSY04957.1 SDR family oxidoreductase [Actinomycetota bacterium]MSZ59059.1 SDR family oxidoreductase [Actinomycetota bacterium]MTA00928.1 SDR family oxidoreductase [Actinomycetota bacterium]